MARTRKSSKSGDTTEENGTMSATAFDLSALSVDFEDEMPARGSTGSGRHDRFPDNPFVDILRDSKHAPAGKRTRGVTVPALNVAETTAAIRNAVDKLAGEGIGTRIAYRWQDENGETQNSPLIKGAPTEGDTPVRVLFEGKTRKRYLSEDEKAEAGHYKFVKADGKLDSAAYLRWVAAERPMQDSDS